MLKFENYTVICNKKGVNVQMSKYKNKILTIPNVLSFFRLCLIPIIMWLYIKKQDYLWTLIVLIFSGVTDIADGIIARKYDMVSDFGKMFDPIADKLTQMATLFCLISRFSYMIYPLVILIFKEVCTGITGLISIKRTNTVEGAVWHGKLTTVTLYTMMGVHLFWYNLPRTVSLIMVGVCIGIMLMSFIMYSVRNITAIKNKSF